MSQNTLLNELNCKTNKLTKLDFSDNKCLVVLDCSFNLLVDLNISASDRMSTLFCNDNSLTSLDMSFTSRLMTLICSNNDLDSLVIRSNTRMLSTLECSNNNPTSLDLSTLPSLGVLECQKNQLSSLDLTSWGPFYYVEHTQKPSVITVDFADGSHFVDLTNLVGVDTIANIENLAYSGTQMLAFNQETGIAQFDGLPAEGDALTYLYRTGSESEASRHLNVTTALTLPTYTLTATAGEGGKVSSASRVQATVGTDAEFAFAAYEGYELDAITINEDSIDVVGNILSITGIASDMDIQATFKKLPPIVDPSVPIDPYKPGDGDNPGTDKPNPDNPGDTIIPPVNPWPPVISNPGVTIIRETVPVNTAQESPKAEVNATTKKETPKATAATKTSTGSGQDTLSSPDGALENPTLEVEAPAHQHIPLAAALLAIWLIGGFIVLSERKTALKLGGDKPCA